MHGPHNSRRHAQHVVTARRKDVRAARVLLELSRPCRLMELRAVVLDCDARITPIEVAPELFLAGEARGLRRELDAVVSDPATLKTGTAKASVDIGFIAEDKTPELPGILKDYWEEEDVVAENSVQTIVTSLQEKADEAGAFLTNVDTHVDTLDDFAGGKHSVILYKYTWDEIPVYGLFVLIRSADRQYLSEIMMESSDAASIEKICGYFSAL